MTQYRAAVFATALLATLLAPIGVAAEIFKCTNTQGVTTYQDIPCKAGNTEERIDLSATTSSAEQSESVKAATEALRKQDQALAERLQRESESRRELAARTPAPTYTQPATDDNYPHDDGYIMVPYGQPVGWRAGVYYPPQNHRYPVTQNSYRNNVYHDFRDSPYYNTVAGYPLPQATPQSRSQQTFSVGSNSSAQQRSAHVQAMGTVSDE